MLGSLVLAESDDDTLIDLKDSSDQCTVAMFWSMPYSKHWVCNFEEYAAMSKEPFDVE